LQADIPVLVAILVAIAGVVMILAGALYMLRQPREYRGGVGEEVKGESIGVILLGPVPIILRGRGGRLLPLLLPIIVAVLVFVLIVAAIIMALL